MEYSKRNIAAYLLCNLYRLTGRLNAVHRRAAQGEILLSVYFHYPSRKLFEGCVRWFLRHGYRIISLSELEAIARGHKPFPQKAVVLTADDGWRSNIGGIAAVADQYKVPVTIFATTSPIETGEPYWWSVVAEAHRRGLTPVSVSQAKQLRHDERRALVDSLMPQVNLGREAMTLEELKAITAKGYVEIGSHTVTHPMLPTCTDMDSFSEINEAGQTLRAWLSKDIPYFAYPNGAYTHREVENLKKCGYRMAFTTEPTYITPENIRQLYSLPRFDVLENVSFAENICRMTGAWFNR